MIRVVIADDQALVRGGFRSILSTQAGIAATRAVVRSGYARVLILTIFDIDEYVYAALKAGASGFILKDGPAEGLPESVRTVAAAHALLAPSVTRRVVEEYVRGAALGAPLPQAILGLTERESAVLKAMAMGLPNAEIGRQLFLAEATVKTHVTHVLAKLSLRDRLQAVVYACESGLVRPGGHITR
jgi:DNA-binding NarL/FixJ family response regulator